jgi:hypothetical protein
MLYFRCSSLTDKDLNTAEAIVKAFLSSKKDYLDFLVKEHTWTSALKRAMPEAYKQIEDRKKATLETLDASDVRGYVEAEKTFKNELIALTEEILSEQVLQEGGFFFSK